MTFENKTLEYQRRYKMLNDIQKQSFWIYFMNIWWAFRTKLLPLNTQLKKNFRQNHFHLINASTKFSALYLRHDLSIFKIPDLVKRDSKTFPLLNTPTNITRNFSRQNIALPNLVKLNKIQSGRLNKLHV